MSKWQAEITDAFKKQIKTTQNDNPVYKWLIENKDTNFAIGDILIKKTGYGDRLSRKVVMVSKSINLPRKYVVQYVDAIGVPYVRTICANGKLGKVLTCIASQSELTHYEHDPDIADHFLLDSDGDEYNPIKELREVKERQTAIRKVNKNNAVSIDCNRTDTVKIFETLKSIMKEGKEFWLVSKPQQLALKHHYFRWGGVQVKAGFGDWGGYGFNVVVKNHEDKPMKLPIEMFVTYRLYFTKPICELTGTIEDE
ncbi:MAG: hypothetical protein HWN81_00050 [Candidatus Lokiarchaeota archaeon]|nr:hypothetical protein [Candidatus Lokiarchaeota archaeon]